MEINKYMQIFAAYMLFHISFLQDYFLIQNYFGFDIVHIDLFFDYRNSRYD